MAAEQTSEKIYIVDAENRPVAVMDAEQVHRQRLWHRGVLLILLDRSGRLVLRRLGKNHPLHPSRWDLTGSGHVLWHEASEEAAWRYLPMAARTAGPALFHRCTMHEGVGTGLEIVDVFHAHIPDPVAGTLARDTDYLLVDQDELHALATSYADQLTPALLDVWRNSPDTLSS
ncbi:MAG: hypothetical protein GXY42_08490 [Desulfovibrionales bacterium]|nr:hypothetical protein [Desulfovibrionales bacterium]